MKLEILVREETMMRCSGRGCLKALSQRKDAFESYKNEDEVELLAFTHSGGDLNRKIERMLEAGITNVHLSSCLRSKSPDYEALKKQLRKHFIVVGYTHGSESIKVFV